jgi:hypothetical protein
MPFSTWWRRFWWFLQRGKRLLWHCEFCETGYLWGLNKNQEIEYAHE